MLTDSQTGLLKRETQFEISEYLPSCKSMVMSQNCRFHRKCNMRRDPKCARHVKFMSDGVRGNGCESQANLSQYLCFNDIREQAARVTIRHEKAGAG